MVIEPRGGALKLGEVGNAAARLLILAEHLVEPIEPDKIAALQRNPSQQQPGIDRVIEPRQPVDRLDHQITGVEGEHDVMIALGAKLLAHQLAVTRGVFPVDEAAVEPGRVVAQRVELGAFALLLLHFAAKESPPAQKNCERGAVHAAHIRHHVDRACRPRSGARTRRARAGRASASRRRRPQRGRAASATSTNRACASCRASVASARSRRARPPAARSRSSSNCAVRRTLRVGDGGRDRAASRRSTGSRAWRRAERAGAVGTRAAASPANSHQHHQRRSASENSQSVGS